MGGSGVQRPTKLVKYWARLGWKVTVITADPTLTLRSDSSLLDDIKHTNISIHRITGGISALNSVKWDLTKISERWLRPIRRWINPWLVPDNKKGWAKQALAHALEVAQNQQFDVVVTTAPPYSACLAGVQIKKALNIPLVLDFRDDWVESHLLRYPIQWLRAKHESLERECIQAADHIWTVNSCIQSSFQQRHTEKEQDITVLAQGYDPEDIPETTSTDSGLNRRLHLLYSGLFYNRNQPDNLLKAVAQLIKQDQSWQSRLCLEFQGGLDRTHKQLIKRLGLSSIVVDHGYVPHKHAVENASRADVLWFIVNFDKNQDCVATSKLYEYMGLRKPILALTTAEMPLKILEDYKSYWSADPKQVEEITKVMEKIWCAYSNKRLVAPYSAYVNTFSRKHIAEESSEILDKICTIAHA